VPRPKPAPPPVEINSPLERPSAPAIEPPHVEAKPVPPPVEPRRPTPLPVVEAAPPVEPPPPPPRPKRPPTPPPPLELPKPSELPQGTFTYPTVRAKTRVPLVIALLLLAALLGGGGMYLLGNDEPKKQPQPQVAAVEVDAAPAPVEPAEAAVVAASIDAKVLEIEPDIEMDPPDAGKRPIAQRTPIAPRPTPRPTPTPTPTPTPAPTPDAAVAVAVEDGCDEVTCVTEKYAKPCCAKWKPTEDHFTPANGTSDALEKPQIKAGIDRVKPAVIACGEKHKAAGTVRVNVSVSPDGVVQSADIEEAPDQALGACVAAIVRKAHFAKTTNGGAFVYPFTFQ
jgi:TonB family protein